MRSLLIITLSLVASTLFGQGVIVFQNAAANVNAPVTNASNGLVLGPSSYVADLFFSTNTQSSMDELAPLNMPVTFSTNPGYFYGGIRYMLPVSTLVQVRVWDSNYGKTYYEARNDGGEFGYSNSLILTPDVPPGGGTYLVGLEGFQLQRLPQLTATVTVTNTIVFSWQVEQTAYSVQQNPNLSPSNWTTVPNAPISIGQQQQVVLPFPAAGKMFYRLISQ
ncbi:MAG TPA: hypothetical protein VL361_11770 [Candidatus Limnocylindrales bacterium]|jgi:hypothetical protein|nr:hypothetical protein [Candidatus Limnocylindrales bacterium]